VAIININTGDTAQLDINIAGREDGIPVPVTEPGWECYSEVINDQGVAVVPTRQITETRDSDGVEHFRSRLLKSESNLLVNDYETIDRPKQYRWKTTVKNDTTGYSYTQTVELAVLK